jgi:hypothetical protein
MYKIYLADSVYAEIVEGPMIKLTTENGEPNDPSNMIYLEKQTYDALTRFIKEHKDELGF